MSAETNRIADALEKIAEEGITIRIVFPDNDKYAIDLAAMKIADAISDLKE